MHRHIRTHAYTHQDRYLDPRFRVFLLAAGFGVGAVEAAAGDTADFLRARAPFFFLLAAGFWVGAVEDAAGGTADFLRSRAPVFCLVAAGAFFLRLRGGFTAGAGTSVPSKHYICIRTYAQKHEDICTHTSGHMLTCMHQDICTQT